MGPSSLRNPTHAAHPAQHPSFTLIESTAAQDSRSHEAQGKLVRSFRPRRSKIFIGRSRQGLVFALSDSFSAIHVESRAESFAAGP
ncbi:hypothetical protein [Sporisorium scitamineum]|uniref:Uncharacterized protein n=1 Tax=Sporisorium scitamineum TaxID=49012 RepID=A0A0F7SE23_9BASI|nr:hypothetical protein [Sporisorium scitamineum]